MSDTTDDYDDPSTPMWCFSCNAAHSDDNGHIQPAAQFIHIDDFPGETNDEKLANTIAYVSGLPQPSPTIHTGHAVFRKPITPFEGMHIEGSESWIVRENLT